MKSHHIAHATGLRSQGGMVILVALVMLVAMSIAAIALMRSVDTASLIAGNLAFRQGATTGGDIGVEEARTALISIGDDLTEDDAAHGYYATINGSVDLTGNLSNLKTTWVAWPNTQGSGKKPVCLDKDSTTGNIVCYIIQRLCTETGDLTPEKCYTYTDAGGRGDEGTRTVHELKLQGPGITADPQGYYRITVRTAGPRNNVSFVQVFVVI